MHMWVLVDSAIACVRLVVEELSNGEQSKLMIVTQHLQIVKSFHEFMFFGINFQYFSFRRLI